MTHQSPLTRPSYQSSRLLMPLPSRIISGQDTGKPRDIGVVFYVILLALYRNGYLSAAAGAPAVVINPLMTTVGSHPGASTSSRSGTYIHSADDLILHSNAIAPPTTGEADSAGPSIASIAGSVVRTLRETCYPQTLIPRGCAGAGKTEAIKETLQLIIFAGN
jgi:hypothetical protein